MLLLSKLFPTFQPTLWTSKNPFHLCSKNGNAGFWRQNGSSQSEWQFSGSALSSFSNLGKSQAKSFRVIDRKFTIMNQTLLNRKSRNGTMPLKQVPMSNRAENKMGRLVNPFALMHNPKNFGGQLEVSWHRFLTVVPFAVSIDLQFIESCLIY